MEKKLCISLFFSNFVDLLTLLFAHAELDAIRSINEISPFSIFLNQGDDWLEAFASCEENRALNILDIIILDIANLKDGESALVKQLVDHIKEIPGCLTAMGEPFDRLKLVGEYVKVPVLNGMKEFLDALHSVRYVGNIKQINDDFSVRVRKTR